MDLNDISRVLSRIKSGGKKECWPWIGRETRWGYGSIGIKGKTYTAQRAIYEALVGPIPEGLQIDHTCHWKDKSCEGGNTCPHRACCNPSHLEAVTPEENLRRSLTISTINANKTHCLRGHPYTPENTRINFSGDRCCKQCDKFRNERMNTKRRELMANGEIIPKIFSPQCGNGHWLVEDNIRVNSKGYYDCKQCALDRGKKRKAKIHAEAALRGEIIKPGPKPKTHCKHGHLLDGANRRNDGRCRACSNIRSSEYHKQRRRDGFKQ